MNESQVFADVLKRATPAEQAAYLDEACAGNPLLRAGVEALLRAHASDPGFLEQPAGPLLGTVDARPGSGSPRGPEPAPPGTEQPGVVLAGRYKLLEAIGEGGMGTVWTTQQTEPVKRLVALKLIKAGLGSKTMLARFEAERQALALMDQPNIAKVLDAGAAPDGRPFFVMELVKGVPVTRYCDEKRLTPRQRLELFVPVCQAVQHAHTKGIIHRDLEPSNVLVALYDDRPVPKVIDFGVAKAKINVSSSAHATPPGGELRNKAAGGVLTARQAPHRRRRPGRRAARRPPFQAAGVTSHAARGHLRARVQQSARAG
jgi:hypothetical protein